MVMKTEKASRRKLVIVGDGACGKTSLLHVFTKAEMPSDYVPTVFDNYVADLDINGNQIELVLFDTAGQEEFDQLRALMYEDTSIVILCYSIDREDSLENTIEKWFPEIKQYCPNVPIVLCGNKIDLRSTNKNFITYEDGREMAGKIGAVAFVECSALTNSGVFDLFETAAKCSAKKTRKMSIIKKVKVNISKRYKRTLSITNAKNLTTVH